MIQAIQKGYRKYHKSIFIIAAFLFLFFLTTVKYPHGMNTQYFQDRWYPCLERVAEGSLYESDYHCSQGPVLFFSLYIIQQVANEHIFTISFHIGILLSLILLLLIKASIEKETKKRHAWILLVLFGIVLYYPFLTIWFDMLLSVLFLVAGAYILFHSSFKYKEIVGTALLLLGILTKITNAPPTIILLCYYFYTIYKTQKELLKKKLLHIGSFFLASGILLVILWPKLFFYYVWAHYYNPKEEVASTVLATMPGIMRGNDIYYTVCMLAGIAMLYVFFKRRDQWSLAAIAAIFPIAIAWNQSTGNQTTMVFYFTSFIALALIAFFLFYQECKAKYKIVCICIILLLVVPFALQVYYDNSLKDAREVISTAGMDLLSEQTTSMLIEQKPNPQSVQTLFLHMQLQGKEITTITPALQSWDVIYSPNTVALGLYPEDEFTKNATYYMTYVDEETFSEFLKRIIDQEFDVLVTHDNGLDNIKSLINTAVDLNANPYTCGVYTPLLYHNIGFTDGTHSATFFFKDQEICYGFARTIHEHYVENIQTICEASGELAEEVRRVLSENGMSLPECEKEGSLSFVTYDYYTIRTVYT